MANSKLTELTENTTPALTDIMLITDDPGGTPASQKITLTNLQKGINPMTTAGDIIVGGASGVPARLAIGANTYVLTSNGTTAAWAAAAAGGGGLYSEYICIQDEKAQNTNSGTFTAGDWRTRDLNTEKADTGGIASVASNQVTLPAGTYRVQASAPLYNTGGHQLRLRDITNSATLVVGQAGYCLTANGGISILSGRFTIAGSTVIELQHRCTTTNSDIGFGPPANFGTEVYAQVEFWKEA